MKIDRRKVDGHFITSLDNFKRYGKICSVDAVSFSVHQLKRNILIRDAIAAPGKFIGNSGVRGRQLLDLRFLHMQLFDVRFASLEDLLHDEIFLNLGLFSATEKERMLSDMCFFILLSYIPRSNRFFAKLFFEKKAS